MNVSFVQAYTVPRTLPARELPAADPAAAAPSADIALIDLHDAGQQLPAREDHRASELVQPRPRGLIAPEPEHPLQSQRADTLLLVHDVPDRREPAHQRRAGPAEDRSGRYRALGPALAAASQPVGHLPPTTVGRTAEPAGEPAPPAEPLQA